MNERYLAYLKLLDSLNHNLQAICDLFRQKNTAVQNGDLTTLETVMRQEQALSLSFRGLEHKKNTLAQELQLEHVPLSSLVSHFPTDMQLQAKKSVEALQDQYKIYKLASESSRNMLECNLHEIEKFLAAQDANATAGPGYTPPAVEPPKNMRSDFRA